MQQTQLVQQLMFGVIMNRETAGSKQQPFNAIDTNDFIYVERTTVSHVVMPYFIYKIW